MPIRNLPAAREGTAKRPGHEAFAEDEDPHFASTKRPDEDSIETIAIMEQETATRGDSQNMFNTAPAAIPKSKQITKEKQIQAGREEFIDPVYAKRFNARASQAINLIQNFPGDPQNLTASREAVQRLFNIYQKMLKIFPGPSGNKDDANGKLTCVEPYPYRIDDYGAKGSKIQIPNNYFLWAVGDQYGTKTVNAERFRPNFNNAGREAPLFDFILKTPEFKMYQKQVTFVYKRLVELANRWVGGIPGDW